MKRTLLVLPVLFAFGTAYAADSTMSGQAATPSDCSADVQKYCSSASTDADKQSCLHENMAKLSDACRTAMNKSSGQQGQNQPSGY